MAITLRSTKGAALTHVEMDTNLTSYYVSSSLNGSILKLFTHGAGSFSATTHSVDLSSFLDDTDTNTTYSISAETVSGGANLRLTDSASGTDDVKLANGTNVTITRTDANTITISSQDTVYTHPSISATSNTSTASPAHGGTFTAIDSVTVNSEGHVTAFNTKTVTLPADNNTEYTAGTGIDITEEVITNTAPDQTVALAGQNITINGSYPNFQLTGSAAVTYTAGTGLSLSENEFSNTAPDQTVTIEGKSIEVNGTYPNFQITGSDASTDVTIAAGRDYITISGQELTLGAIDLTTDVTGILPAANIAAIALTSVQTAADEAAMLALTTQEGDVVVRTDESKTYMHNGGTAGDMTDFTELSTPQNYTHPTLTPTENTSAASPAHGETFTAIDSITINGTGHVSAINTKTVTLPADNNTTYSVFDDETDGLVPNPGETGTTKFLRQDGTWVVPTDTDTVYTHPSISATENTSNASPAHGGTFTAVDSVTVNSEGHVTAYNLKTVTLPADDDTTYTAGNGLGLTGTSFSLDTPSTLTVSSTNGVTENSHTHAITTTTNGTASTIVATDSNSEITAANFITTSDRRLKSEIEPIKDGLEVIKNIVSYEYLKGGVKEAGFIAQEVQEVLPYAVREGEDGYLKMTDRAILAHLNKAVQQLEERLSTIEEKLG